MVPWRWSQAQAPASGAGADSEIDDLSLQGEVLRLDGAWGDPERAAPLVRAQASGTVGSLEEAAALGTEVAARLRAGGAH